MSSRQSPVLSLQKKLFTLSTIYYLLSTVTFLSLCGCQQRPLYSDTRAMMGTFVEVISPDKRAPEIAFKEMKRIEGLLSKYLPESEISRLNKDGRLTAGPETFYIISRAKELWIKSGGAFDVTVGPLLDLWGFSNRDYMVPSKEQIEEALKLVGSDKIILNPEDNVIELKNRGMKIDLGAIAKGYAADCAAKKLKESGIKNCLINTGGQVYCLGKKFNRPWRIALKNPYKKAFKDYFSLADKAIATSGDYQQHFAKGKASYGHIFDPRTGYPAASGVASVTVIADDGLTADSLATAIFVLGKEKTAGLLREFPGAKALVYQEKELK